MDMRSSIFIISLRNFHEKIVSMRFVQIMHLLQLPKIQDLTTSIEPQSSVIWAHEMSVNNLCLGTKDSNFYELNLTIRRCGVIKKNTKSTSFDNEMYNC